MATLNYTIQDKIIDSSSSVLLDNRTTFLAGSKQVTNTTLNDSSLNVDITSVDDIKRFTIVTDGEVNIVITIDAVATTLVCDGYFSLSTTNAFWNTIDSIVITEVNEEDVAVSIYTMGEDAD